MMKDNSSGAGAASFAQWQPISTAPKDGTHITVCKEGQSYLPATVHWFDGGWHLSVNQRGEYSEYIWGPPTHWRPLPVAPEVT